MGKIISLIFLTICLNVNAGDSLNFKSIYIGINGGLSYHSYIEPYESANEYAGVYFPIKLSLTTFKDRYIDQFKISYYSLSPHQVKTTSADLTNFSSKNFDIFYGYHRKITTNKDNKIYLGASILSRLTFKELNYRFDHTVIVNPVELFNSANFAALYQTSLKENLLLVGFNYQLLSYIVYNKYSLNAPFIGDFYTLTDCINLNFDANYSYQITTHLLINFGYQFCYYSFAKEQSIENTDGVHHLFVLGLNIKL